MPPFTCANCGVSIEGKPVLCPTCGAPPALAGRWWLAEKIGSGAFGTTWRAEGEQGAAAVKEIPLARLDRKGRALLEREIEVLHSLPHPCIPALHEALTTGDGERRRAWLAMDFVPGRTLRAEMSAERHGLPEALAILAGVAEVLAYLHELTPPVIHRDLKPENLIRHARSGRWWLVDFG